MPTPLRLLLIEDNQDDADLLLHELYQGGFKVTHERVETAEAMAAALARDVWDCVISDFSLPHFNGLAALELYRESGLNLPFIIVSGTIPEETAIAAMRTGAHDFVMKDKLGRLPAAIGRELREAETRRARRKAEETRRQLIAILEATPDFVGMADAQGRGQYLNHGGRKLLGIREDEDITGFLIVEGHPERTRTLVVNEAIPTAMRDGLWRGETALLSREGREIPVLQVIIAHKSPDGTVEHLSTIARDITERKRAEQAQGIVGDILRALNASPSVVEAFPVVVAGLKALTGCERLSLALFDESCEWATFVALDQERPELGRGSRLRLTDSAASSDLLAGRVHLTPDLTGEVDFPGERALYEAGYRSRLNLPLSVGQRVTGALNLAWLRPAGCDTDQLPLLEQIAEAVALAVERSRLFDETRRRLANVQALQKIDLAITASLDLRATLNVFLDQGTAQLGVDAAAVLLSNPPTQTLNYAVGRGFRTIALQQTRLRLGEGYAGRAALERRMVNIPDLRGHHTDFLRSPHFAQEAFVAYYAVPLIAKGQVQGVLEVFHRAPLTPTDEWLNFLETLAGQAAIAIDNATLFDNLQRSNVNLTIAYDATIEGWSAALDLRDKETEGHTQRVTKMTERLARATGLSEAELVHIRWGALLHDIGKMGVPDDILLKPGKLTDEEWVIMKKHPQFAYDMLSPITYLRRALDIPYCHHEKWDGTGYPRGLKGEQIPLAARIFAVVDVWDALRSDRPYRPAWPEEKVLEHVRQQAGKHFDPKVVEAFLKLEGVG